MYLKIIVTVQYRAIEVFLEKYLSINQLLERIKFLSLRFFKSSKHSM